MTKVDYDGNGDANEDVAQDIEHLRARLLAAIMDYAKTVAGKPIVYDINEFPLLLQRPEWKRHAADKDEAERPQPLSGLDTTVAQSRPTTTSL